jgi:hypothetical protein
LGVDPSELPSQIVCFKDNITNQEFLLIGTSRGSLFLYDLNKKEFITSNAIGSQIKPIKVSKVGSRILQLKKNEQADM